MLLTTPGFAQTSSAGTPLPTQPSPQLTPSELDSMPLSERLTYRKLIVEALTRRAIELSQRIDASEASIATLEQKLSDSEATRQRQEQELETLRQDLTSLREDLQKTLDALEKSKAEVLVLKKRIAELEGAGDVVIDDLRRQLEKERRLRKVVTIVGGIVIVVETIVGISLLVQPAR